MIKVLLVDDHELVRTAIRKYLEEIKNIKVVGETASGEDAVAWARKNEADVVLMDMIMPGMNGLEATREIRKLENLYAAGIPIIAMTADAFSENVAECLEAGMNGHIAKPIDINNVLKELRKIRQAKPDFTKRDDYEN